MSTAGSPVRRVLRDSLARRARGAGATTTAAPSPSLRRKPAFWVLCMLLTHPPGTVNVSAARWDFVGHFFKEVA
jgi:hypothetical protein